MPLIPALRRYAWGLCRHAQDADDLVQDSLVRAMSAWDRRRADGNLRSWLFTILYNGFVSQRRRDRFVVPNQHAEEPTASATQEHRALLSEMDRALATLPEEQRSVLLLIAVEEFSYAEAAETLGIPVGTVMSRLSRARERLRALVDVPGSGDARLRRVK